MNRLDLTLSALPDATAVAVLRRLHAEAAGQTRRLVRHYLRYLPRVFTGRPLPWGEMAAFYDDKFIALEPAQGVFCYLTCRALRATRVVEFGTSFGVSTIYLALAVRDNGGGRVTGTELVPAKAARARAHLAEAGLSEFVEVREGDARETLREIEGPIDFLLNDGFPPAAEAVARLVAPQLRPGAVVLTDNVGTFRADLAGYLRYVRDPRNGFVSGRLPLKGGTEYSVRQ